MKLWQWCLHEGIYFSIDPAWKCKALWLLLVLTLEETPPDIAESLILTSDNGFAVEISFRYLQEYGIPWNPQHWEWAPFAADGWVQWWDASLEHTCEYRAHLPPASSFPFSVLWYNLNILPWIAPIGVERASTSISVMWIVFNVLIFS